MANTPNKNIAVIVTGAARGLGRAMTIALAKAGVDVGAADLPAADDEMRSLLATAQQGGFGTHILPLHADVTEFGDCERAVDIVVERFGGLHGLVNNAARGPQEFGPVLLESRKRFYEVDLDLWRTVINTNVNGCFCMAKAVAPRLVKQGWGRIVNVVTSYRTMQSKGISAYGPSKGAMEVATVVWSKDLAGTGVTVNALLPGRAASTRMIPSDEYPDRAALVQPEAMGPPIVWLMSTASNGVTGQRFISENWDPRVPTQEAVKKAGGAAGWGE